MKLLQQLFTIAIVMLTLDFIYISANKNTFEIQVADVQRVSLQMRPVGAILSYIALIFGLYYFIIKPHRPIFDALLLGLVIYAVYEGTTYALLKKWKWNIVIMDTLWGGILFALTTFITYKIDKYFS